MSENSNESIVRRKTPPARVKRLWRNLLRGGLLTLALFSLTAATSIWLVYLTNKSVSSGSVLRHFVALLCFFSIIVNTCWLFYVLAPLIRNRVVSAVVFGLLFAWGCDIYFFSKVSETARGDSGPAEVRSAGKLGNQIPTVEFLISAPNRAVASFFPSRGGYEDVEDKDLRLWYFIFHSIVLFYVVLIPFAFFGRGIVNRVLKWLCYRKRLNVFWGWTPPGRILAKDIMDTTLDHVFICLPRSLGDGDNRRSLTAEMDSIGAMWSFSDEGEDVINGGRDTLAELKGRRHFFLHESGHVNVSRANRLIEVLKEEKRICHTFRGFVHALRAGCMKWWMDGYEGEKPYFYIRVDSSADEKVFRYWAANVRDWVNPVIVKESHCIAKDFVDKYPMLSMPGVKIDHDTALVAGKFKILLIGFGAIGHELLAEMVCNAQFEGPNEFSVDIIEKDQSVIDAYKAGHKEAMEEYHIAFLDPHKAYGGEEFGEFIRGHIGEYNRIVVSLPGTAQSVCVATEIDRLATLAGVDLGEDRLFAKSTDPVRNQYAPKLGEPIWNEFSRRKKNQPLEQHITLFGNLKTIYTLELINEETADRMAKVLNWGYNQKEDMETKWDDASMFDHESSRASAEGHRNLLALLGYGLAPKGSADGGDDCGDDLQRQLDQWAEDLKAKPSAENVLLTLAKDEHLRWNAFHRMLGFSRWTLPARAEVDKVEANQLARYGQHADLVPFGQLPDVDCAIDSLNHPGDGKRRSPNDYRLFAKYCAQSYDLIFCQAIPKAASAAGLRIVKT